MTPDQAGAALNQMSAAFHPAPAPLAPATAHEADVRLAQLSADGDWYRKLMAGDMETRREFNRLTELKAGVTATDPLAEQIGDTTIGDTGLARRYLISVAEDMRAEGVFNEEGIALILGDGKFSADDTYAAQYWLGQMERDETLLYPELGGTRDQQLQFLRTIAVIGTGDMP
jgi:hypothetical protein